MAAKVLVDNARVYTHIKDELVSPPTSGTTIPGAGADMTAFRALAGMTNAAFLVISIDNVDYALPLLLTT